MVSTVRILTQKRPRYTEKIFDDQEFLVRNLLTAVKNNNETEMMQIIQKGERNLEKLGVVSEYVKKIIRAIEKSGGAAKICGAGGKTKGKGIILTYHPDKSVIKSLTKVKKLSYYAVQLGGEGVKYYEDS
jgi:mevalonate kinase